MKTVSGLKGRIRVMVPAHAVSGRRLEGEREVEGNPVIELKHISVAFDGEPILQDLNLSIRDGEFVTLLGPSGCGKTTTLRIIGGFVNPDAGDILFNGKRINDLPPYKRGVNTIFQKYALFPHLNVFENVASACVSRRRAKRKSAKR